MKTKSSKTASFLTSTVADRDEWVEFLGLNPSIETLKHVGISVGQWQQIVSGKRVIVPISAYRQASFQHSYHLADLLGKEWQDFYIRHQSIEIPGVRYPYTAPELRSTWINLQRLERAQNELERMRKETDWVEVSPAVSAWLKRLGQRPLVVVAA